jgi:hypothetical protein
MNLTIFTSPEDKGPKSLATSGGDHVTVPLGEILPILVDACITRRAWVRDFEDELVTLSADLYEVLQAYRFLRKASA